MITPVPPFRRSRVAPRVDVLSRERGSKGQSTVEFALVLPLFLLLALTLVQAALVVRAQILVVEAARAGARAAAVDPRESIAAQAAMGATPLVADDEHVSLTQLDGEPPLVEVVVRYRVPIEVPLVMGLLDDVTVTGSATMAVEVPETR